MVQRTFATLLCAAIISSTAFAGDLHLLAEASAENPPAEAQASSSQQDAAVAALPLAEGGKMTLEMAIQRALANSPRLKASAASALASKGDRRQAVLLPNPELAVEAENIYGERDYRGFNFAEVRYGISQLI